MPWGEEIWSKRADAAGADARAKYLDNYTKTLPGNMKPNVPSLDTVLDILKNPKHTSPGPDGLPFSLYGELSDITAPVLHGIVCHMAEATSPRNLSTWEISVFSPKTNPHSLHVHAPSQ